MAPGHAGRHLQNQFSFVLAHDLTEQEEQAA
jgi:hypothetical protein